MLPKRAAPPAPPPAAARVGSVGHSHAPPAGAQCTPRHHGRDLNAEARRPGVVRVNPGRSTSRLSAVEAHGDVYPVWVLAQRCGVSHGRLHAAYITALGKLSGATTQSNETLRLALKPLKLAHTNGHP